MNSEEEMKCMKHPAVSSFEVLSAPEPSRQHCFKSLIRQRRNRCEGTPLTCRCRKPSKRAFTSCLVLFPLVRHSIEVRWWQNCIITVSKRVSTYCTHCQVCLAALEVVRNGVVPQFSSMLWCRRLHLGTISTLLIKRWSYKVLPITGFCSVPTILPIETLYQSDRSRIKSCISLCLTLLRLCLRDDAISYTGGFQC